MKKNDPGDTHANLSRHMKVSRCSSEQKGYEAKTNIPNEKEQ
jgi:hypothetical protein